MHVFKPDIGLVFIYTRPAVPPISETDTETGRVTSAIISNDRRRALLLKHTCTDGNCKPSLMWTFVDDFQQDSMTGLFRIPNMKAGKVSALRI